MSAASWAQCLKVRCIVACTTQAAVLALAQAQMATAVLLSLLFAGYDNIEERINAGITAALKAAARRISAKASAASKHAASPQGVGSPLQQARPGELAPAAAPEALSAQCQEGATADAVAAAMQEWAAAMLETQLGQQLRQQVQQLEQDVEGLKDNVATHLSISKAQETQVQQLKEWQAQVQQGLAQEQQRLTQEAGTWQKQLVQQQELVAALTAEVQELRQQQQRPSTPVMQELLSELRVEAQLQTAQLGKQQVRRRPPCTLPQTVIDACQSQACVLWIAFTAVEQDSQTAVGCCLFSLLPAGGARVPHAGRHQRGTAGQAGRTAAAPAGEPSTQLSAQAAAQLSADLCGSLRHTGPKRPA
jgi:hypothetical protein